MQKIHIYIYICDVFKQQHVSGDGKYTKLCHQWFKEHLQVKQALLVHSGTASLELAAMLAELTAGDEVIMPSYTFCSTANAFVLQGAVPVFVDIRSDTLNIDENKIEEAITPKTKAIVPVHYAGVACNMDAISFIARKYNLIVIEDAAQAFDSYYKGKPLGTLGDMGCMSFHETKNIMCGEGGLFITNNNKYSERAEIIREKGTNRSQFFRGQVDKYRWIDKGSSYLPSDIISAYLLSVLEMATEVQKKRKYIWKRYYEELKVLENDGKIKLPVIPDECTNNAHMFYILAENLDVRSRLIDYLRLKGIYAPFHYVPLHSAPAGFRYCRYVGSMDITDKISNCLLRLPLYYGMNDSEIELVIKTIHSFYYE